MRYAELDPGQYNALTYFGGVTPTITPDNCKVAVARNKDWISPVLNKDFQAWAEHKQYGFNPCQSENPPLETSCGRPRKDHYHAHPHGYGRYGLLFGWMI